MRKLLIILALLLQGCIGPAYVRVGVLYDFKQDIAGDNPMAVIEVGGPVTENIDCGYTHISHYTSGYPFNDRYEQNADTIGCYWKVW